MTRSHRHGVAHSLSLAFALVLSTWASTATASATGDASRFGYVAPANSILETATATSATPSGDVTEEPSGPRTGSALLQATYVNTAFWVFNRFIRENGENPGFRIGFDSWRENFANGYEWDDNNFFTNQFGHPYQGSMYYTGARASGFGFWGSIPVTFFGSAQWEYMWETHHPSYNDWITTSLGGVALGEMLWRVTDLVLDDRVTGRERTGREVAGLLLNPIRGLNRIATGDWSRVRENDRRLLPNDLGLRVEAGLRTVGSVDVSDPDTTRTYLEVAIQYGDPFTDDDLQPFDTIEISTLLNFGDASVLGGVTTSGILGGTRLGSGDSTQHLLAGFLDFDYFDTYAYQAGHQSVGLGLLSRFDRSPVGRLQTRVQLNSVVLGGVDTDYESFTGRDYDYGPGASAIVSAALGAFGRPWLMVRHAQFYIHTVNGNAGRHFLSSTRAQARIPLRDELGLNLEYLLYLAEADYEFEDLADTSSRHPEGRISLSMRFR